MIRISSDHAVLSWIYNHFKYFLAIETYENLMET